MPLDNSRIITGLPELPQDVPEDQYSQLYKIYIAIANLKRAMSEYCGVDSLSEELRSQTSPLNTVNINNMTRAYYPASEPLIFGAMVNIWNDSGTMKIRKASASSASTLCHGVVASTSGASVGEYVEINLWHGITSGIGAMTAGSLYYLSTTPGVIINSPPVAVGTIRQAIGVALTSDILSFNISSFIFQN